MPPMALRVLAVTQSAELGGAELALLRVGPLLAAEGIELELAVPEEGPVAAAARERGLPLHLLPVGPLRTGGWRLAVRSWPRARTLARSRRPDVVWLNGIVPQRLVPALGSAPALLQLHDVPANEPRAWRSAGFWRRVPVVVCGSRLAADAAAAAGAPQERLRVVPVPVEAVDPAPRPDWADGRPVVGFVGRFEPVKGVLVLLEAASRLLERRPDLHFVLVSGPAVAAEPRYEQRVREEAAKLGEAVSLVEAVPDARVLMRWFDVLCAPSLSESFGAVAAEALAAGTPAVVTEASGIAEQIRPGGTGDVVPPGDPERLAAALERTLDGAAEMADAARASVGPFETGRVARELARLLREAAGK